jgi:O-methyltransferase
LRRVNNVARLLARAAEKFCGIRIIRTTTERNARFGDLSPEMRTTIEQAQPYTMTSPERLTALCMAVEYTVGTKVPGAFVECGVWKGGSSMAAAITYRHLQRCDIDMFLFDTFEGMSHPSREDVHTSSGRTAEQLLANSGRDSEVWAYAPIEEVKNNLRQTGYPPERVHFVQGKVEDTIPDRAPDQISILRLDTDWYESTRHELIHLFPKLSPGGILIIDDYGAWTGARKAVDEYFAALGITPFLNRIDTTGRLYVKALNGHKEPHSVGQ